MMKVPPSSSSTRFCFSFCFSFYLLLTIIFLPAAQALVGAGGYVPFAGQMQTDKEGGSNVFSPAPYIAGNSQIQITGSHYFRPELGFVFNDNGDSYSKHTLFLLYHFQYSFNSYFFLNYGAGTFLTRISGEGNTVVLNNGAGTATFYQPKTTSSSYNTTIDLGMEFFINPHYSLAANQYWFGFLSSTKRQFSYSLSFNYKI